MTVDKIGYDLDSLNNISAPNISISQDPSELMVEIVRDANTLTNNLIGFVMLVPVFVMTFLRLTEKQDKDGFGFGMIRGLTVSCSLCSILALEMLELQILNNFFVVSFFTTLFIIGAVMLVYIESK